MKNISCFKSSAFKRFSEKISISFFLLFIAFIGIFISCEKDPNTKRARILTDRYKNDNNQYNRYNQDTGSRFSGSCKSRESKSDVISIRGDLDYVDSINVGNYPLKGRCDNHNNVVAIKVNGYDISDNPACNRGRWELELDFTSIASPEKDIILHISHSGETICQRLRVAFSGPVNYIPVPYMEDYYESSFFVMKYEAKLTGKGSSSAKAISQPEERPITRVTYDEAVKLCRNNGSRYDLMQNSQWQNIALSIEETDINWSSGRQSSSENNSLNCGVTSGGAKPASSNDRDDCADSSCNAEWDFKRRTHILSNGQVIWDICGNVGELMKDKYTLNRGFDGSVFELSGELKRLFGPDRNYNIIDSDRRSLNWGLGEADIEGNHNLIVRGFAPRARGKNGIFSVAVTEDQSSRRTLNQQGFRCVYIP